MKKIILVNGLIAGTIVSAMLLISYSFSVDKKIDMDSSMLIGYASMVISLSVIFFGVKTYRDHYLGGSISFGNALMVGMLITVVATLLYATTWVVYSYTVATDFSEFFTQSYLEDLSAKGATEAEIQAEKTKLEEWSEMYENPVIRFLMTTLEILPVGIIISLVAAAILRKRQILPA